MCTFTVLFAMRILDEKDFTCILLLTTLFESNKYIYSMLYNILVKTCPVRALITFSLSVRTLDKTPYLFVQCTMYTFSNKDFFNMQCTWACFFLYFMLLTEIACFNLCKMFFVKIYTIRALISFSYLARTWDNRLSRLILFHLFFLFLKCKIQTIDNCLIILAIRTCTTRTLGLCNTISTVIKLILYWNYYMQVIIKYQGSVQGSPINLMVWYIDC